MFLQLHWGLAMPAVFKLRHRIATCATIESATEDILWRPALAQIFELHV